MADGYTQKYDTQDMQEIVVDGMAKAGITSLDFLPIWVLILIVTALIGGIAGLVVLFRKRR